MGFIRIESGAIHVYNVLYPQLQNGQVELGIRGIFKAYIPKGYTLKLAIKSFARMGVYVSVQNVNAWNKLKWSNRTVIPDGTELWIADVRKKSSAIPTQTGLASWYGRDFIGKTTANGEVFTGRQFTAAHKKLPFGSVVKVTNLINGKSIVVRINDRGPYIRGRVIDLSPVAASALKIRNAGVVRVRLEVLS